MAQLKSNIKLTKVTPYLALTGELWGVFCEDLGEYDRVLTAPHCNCINQKGCLMIEYWCLFSIANWLKMLSLWFLLLFHSSVIIVC